MIHIDEKIYLWLILSVGVLFLLFSISRIRMRRQQKQFSDENLLKRLAPDRSRFKPLLKLGILSVVIVALSVALANPKVGTKLETVKREGVDVFFVIDVSKSMLVEDVAPNRLEKAKRLVSETLNQLKGDRVGIVAYAASAYPLLPLTTDHSAAKMFLQSMDTDMLSSQGTAIQEAIRMTCSYFDNTQETARILIIVSDGEDHEMGALEVSEEAVNQGVSIYAIGIGTEKGGPIPIKQGNVTQSYKRDKNGEVVISRLNENLLKEIAENANGKYINGENTKETIDELITILDGTQKTEFETQKFVDYQDQFQWFLAVALLLLVFDLFIFERKTLWVKKLNLFNEKK